MRSTTLLMLTALVALVALAGAAGARPPFGGGFFGPHGGADSGRFLEMLADRLEVDEETRGAIDEKFQASREQAEPLRAELHGRHVALREMLRADEPDREAVMAQAERIGELETGLRKLRLATLLEVRALLSDEQRAELAALHEERMQSRMEPMLEACAADVDKLCASVEDPRSLFRCLRENRDGLSETCSEAIDQMKRGRSRGHHGFGRRGGPYPGCERDAREEGPKEPDA